MKAFFHLILICIFPFCSSGQLTLGGSNPQEIVQSALAGSGANISNIQYTGSPEAIAYFSANNYYMTFHSGLLMTTGSKFLAVGPNNSTNAGVRNGAAGYQLMNSTFNTTSYDCAILSFNVTPSGNSIRLNYSFASEEYNPEQTGLNNYNFNDAFAIFVSGPGINGMKNIAVLPNNAPISIRTINPSTNSQYLLENGNGDNPPYNNSTEYLQYDKVVFPLTAVIENIFPGSTYSFTIIIADGGDDLLDSGVFIEEGSITAGLGENDLSNFVNVFYNPEIQKASIKITEYQENLTYSVVDLSGKTIVRSQISETTTLDLSDYSSGMYLITVESANGKISKKVVR
ncbi:hypothetical protein D3C71_839980 [compost metagenome]